MKIECCICLEDLATNGDCKVKTPKCGHLFHENCINAWLKNKASCPQCRLTVNQNDLHFVHLTSSVASSRRSSILNSSVCQDLRELNENLLAQQDNNRKEMEQLKQQVDQLEEQNRKLKDENRKLKKQNVIDCIQKLTLENEFLKGEISGRSNNNGTNGHGHGQPLRRQQSADYKEVQSIVAKAWKKH